MGPRQVERHAVAGARAQRALGQAQAAGQQRLAVELEGARVGRDPVGDARGHRAPQVRVARAAAATPCARDDGAAGAGEPGEPLRGRGDRLRAATGGRRAPPARCGCGQCAGAWRARRWRPSGGARRPSARPRRSAPGPTRRARCAASSASSPPRMAAASAAPINPARSSPAACASEPWMSTATSRRSCCQSSPMVKRIIAGSIGAPRSQIGGWWPAELTGWLPPPARPPPRAPRRPPGPGARRKRPPPRARPAARTRRTCASAPSRPART